MFVHRDPLKVLPSVARLTEVLRAPFTRRVDRADVGDWLAGAARMVEASGSLPDSTRVMRVHYSDLVARPLEVVGEIYRGFDFSLSTTTAQRIARLVEREPRGGYGLNQYSFEQYGLDPAQERKRFQPYVEHFRVALEHEAGPRTAGPARRPVRPLAPAHGIAPTA